MCGKILTPTYIGQFLICSCDNEAHIDWIGSNLYRAGAKYPDQIKWVDILKLDQGITMDFFTLIEAG
jgi:hypothetical protein